MLKTPNVFVDTQVFISSNYFEGINLERLLSHGNTGTIKLYLTEMTKHEIKSNIKQDLFQALDQINSFKKKFASHNKIVKNFEGFKKYLEIPGLDIEVDSEELFNKLNLFIKNGNVKDIPLNYADINDIVQQYFKQELPFSNTKRHEFPDAIVLSAIENWCLEKGERMYLVSDDPDMMKYESENILPIKNLKDILDLIIKQEAHDRKEKEAKLLWIDELFENNEAEIIAKIKQKFIETTFDEIGFEIEISNVKVESIELSDYSLVDDNNIDGYIFQLDYSVDFTCEITYDDLSESTYDKEDDILLFVQRITRPFELNYVLSAEIAIDADFEEPLQEPVIICTHASTISEADLAERIENEDSEY
jgi:hypothetical protein